MVGLDDFFRRGEPQAASPFAGRKKGTKDFLERFWFHSDAGVDDFHVNELVVRAAFDDQFAAVGHGLLGVEEKIQDGLAKKIAIDAGSGERFGQIVAQEYAVQLTLRRLNSIQFPQHFIDVDRLGGQVADPSEAKKVLENNFQAVTFPLQRFDLLQRPAVPLALGLLKILGEQLKVEAQRTERVFNFVGQAAARLASSVYCSSSH